MLSHQQSDGSHHQHCHHGSYSPKPAHWSSFLVSPGRLGCRLHRSFGPNIDLGVRWEWLPMTNIEEWHPCTLAKLKSTIRSGKHFSGWSQRKWWWLSEVNYLSPRGHHWRNSTGMDGYVPRHNIHAIKRPGHLLQERINPIHPRHSMHNRYRIPLSSIYQWAEIHKYSSDMRAGQSLGFLQQVTTLLTSKGFDHHL